MPEEIEGKTNKKMRGGARECGKKERKKERENN